MALEFNEETLNEKLETLKSISSNFDVLWTQIEIESRDFEQTLVYQIGELAFEIKCLTTPKSRKELIDMAIAVHLQYVNSPIESGVVSKIMENRKYRIMRVASVNIGENLNEYLKNKN